MSFTITRTRSSRNQFPPSRIARRIAASLWPDVQHQQMIAKGVYWFSSAGHGGCVAVRGVADIDDATWELGCKLGLTEFVGRQHSQLFDSAHYTRESIQRLPHVSEVWVGEEDCEWASVYLAHRDVDTLIDRDNAKTGRTITREYVEKIARQYQHELYEALTGKVVDPADSYSKRRALGLSD